MNLSILFLLVCIGLAVVLAAVGVVRVVGLVGRTKRRLAGYSRLPIVALAGATRGQLAAAERRVDDLPSLAERLRRALADLRAAWTSLTAAAATVLATIRALPLILIEHMTAPLPTARRTPGN